MDFLLRGTSLVEIQSNTDMSGELNQQDVLRSLREETGMNRTQFSNAFDIPIRSLEEWESGRRKIAPYNLRALVYYVRLHMATEDINAEESESGLIQWHPAFCAALRLDLAQYADSLIFEDEFQLSHKPLQIDCVVIKKHGNAVIENKIGDYFRKINIFEYKSPDDKLNIKTYYKAVAYAYLYMSLPQQKDLLTPNDVTISLVRATKPIMFLKQLQKIGIQVTEITKGVYSLTGAVTFSTRLIVSSELETDKHIALKALNTKISRRLYGKYIEYMQIQNGSMRELADVVMQPIAQSNNEQISKWKEDKKMCQALKEIMADEIAEMKFEAVESGRQEGIEKGRQEGIEKGRQEGMEKGRQEGMEKGRQEGMEQGRQEGVVNSVIMMGKEFGLSSKDMIAKIKDVLDINEASAKKLYKMYS